VLPYLQFLRGAAALMVMLFNYRYLLDNTLGTGKLGVTLFGQGYMGVDLFFILSGFMAVFSTQGPEHANPLNFLIRRFFRVVPLAWLATLSYYFLEGAVHSPGALLSSLAFIPSGNANPPFRGDALYGMIWPISYGIYFCLVFSVALFFSHRYRTVVATFLLGFSLFVFQFLIGGSFTLGAHQATLPVIDLGYFPNPLLPIFGNSISLEFAVGMILAEAYCFAQRKYPIRKNFATFPISGVFISVFLYYFLSDAGEGHGLLGKGLGATCLMMAFLLLQHATDRQWTTPGPWLYLGAISYPLFLLHNGTVNGVLQQLHVFGVPLVDVNGPMAFLIHCGLAFLLACGCHIFLELPFQAAGRRYAFVGMPQASQSGGIRFLAPAHRAWSQGPIRILVASLGLLLIPLAASYVRKFEAKNLLAGDGSFESTIGAWRGNIPLAPGESVFTPGHSTHLVTTGLRYIESPRIKVERGKRYRIDLKALVRKGAIRLQLLGGEKQVQLAETHSYPTLDWMEIAAVTNNPIDCDFLVVSIDDYHVASDFDIDAVVLRECPMTP